MDRRSFIGGVSKKMLATLVLSSAHLVQVAVAQNQPAQPSISCALQKSGAEYKGVCEIPCQIQAFLAVTVLGADANCTAPPRRRAAVLSRTEKGAGWLGEMEGLYPADPRRFEIVDKTSTAAGIAKTPFGWFALRSFELREDAMNMEIAIDKLLPPTADDIRIIKRALELLADASTWNRRDDRNCPPNALQLSLFCALNQATIEVSGGIHYRQPAGYAVRQVLDEVGGNRVAKHRLMDYNNHPDTTLEDIHNLLRTAQSRLEKQMHQ